MISLNVEAAGYSPWIARLNSGLPVSSEVSASSAFWLNGFEKTFGSNDGPLPRRGDLAGADVHRDEAAGAAGERDLAGLLDVEVYAESQLAALLGLARLERVAAHGAHRVDLDASGAVAAAQEAVVLPTRCRPCRRGRRPRRPVSPLLELLLADLADVAE